MNIVELHVIVNNTKHLVLHKSVFTMNLCRQEQQNILGLHVKYPIFFSDFKQIRSFMTTFHKSLEYQILSKSVHWEPRCCVMTDGRT